jgi:hypothetical protein
LPCLSDRKAPDFDVDHDLAVQEALLNAAGMRG